LTVDSYPLLATDAVLIIAFTHRALGSKLFICLAALHVRTHSLYGGQTVKPGSFANVVLFLRYLEYSACIPN
jgi:hypothetical protein